MESNQVILFIRELTNGTRLTITEKDRCYLYNLLLNHRIPIILGLILDSVRTNALTIEEIQNEVLATLINDPNIQTYKEKVKYFISNLLDKGLIVIEKEE